MNRSFAAAVSLSVLLVAPARAAAPAAEEPPRKTVTICGESIQLMTGDEVRSLGFPWVDVLDAENAATYYIQGANALHALTQPDGWFEQFTLAADGGWDDAKVKELAAHLDAAQPALDHYRKGSTMKLCQLPYSKTEMVAGMMLPGLRQTRDAAEARRFEAAKEFSKAVDNYLAIVRIGNHHGRSRTLIDHLVGIACISVGTQTAFKGICLHKYPEQELKRLIEELVSLRDGLPDFAHAMQSERAFGLGTVDDIMRLGPASAEAAVSMRFEGAFQPSPLVKRIFRILFPDRTIKADMARFYDWSIADAKKPFYVAPPLNVEEYLRTEMKPWNFFAAMFLPSLGRAHRGRKVPRPCRPAPYRRRAQALRTPERRLPRRTRLAQGRRTPERPARRPVQRQALPLHTEGRRIRPLQRRPGQEGRRRQPQEAGRLRVR